MSVEWTDVLVVPVAEEYTREAEERTYNPELDRNLCFKKTVEIGEYSVSAGTLDYGSDGFCSSDKVVVTVEENQEIGVNLLINPP